MYVCIYQIYIYIDDTCSCMYLRLGVAPRLLYACVFDPAYVGRWSVAYVYISSNVQRCMYVTVRMCMYVNAYALRVW
jgi:hypothetical protein